MTQAAIPDTAVVLPVTPAVIAPKIAFIIRRKWLLLSLLLGALIVLGGVFAYRRTQSVEPDFRTVKVVSADITQHVTATGTLQPVITSPVGAQVSGIVWKLHADFNSKVSAGQILVELDPALFQNAVDLATAQLSQAQAGLSSARSTASGAKLARDRTSNLERGGIASTADLDASVALFGQSAGLSQSSVALVAQARAQLDRARLDLQHSIIRSPVDGTVISRNIDVGQAVAATLTAPTLFTIAQDLRHMQVHAAVDEADIGDVRAGQTATFSVDAFRGATFNAVVREVRNAPQTAQNVVTYDVVLDVENPEEKLRPGMTANVLILIVKKTQVNALPNEALRFRPAAPAGSAPKTSRDGDVPLGPAVYVPENGAAVRAPVKVGVTDGNMTEVEGLEPGREVIIDVGRGKAKALPKGDSGRGY